MVKTLLIDGDNLFKIGFHGVKEYYHNGNHIGAIYHFVNTLRRFLHEHNFDKVIVVWDGNDNAIERRRIFPEYKMNRRDGLNEIKKDSFNWQKKRVREYLEEMFIRQVMLDGCESDDVISYYCQISADENKIILSADKDLTQLISENVTIYSPIAKEYLKIGSKIKIGDISIPHQNVVTYKILSGDKSDNVDGIRLLGEKTIIKLFPEVLDNVVSVDHILNRAEELLKEDKDNKALKNLLTGVTKRGVFGNEFFEINKKLVDLSQPLMNDEAKEEVELYYKENLDPDGRGYKNLMRMMMDDGLFKFLPKHDNAWVDFLTPFMKLTRKEKKRYTNKK